MSWQDMYPLADRHLDATRLRVPPQLPEMRGKWNLAQVPDYFRQEVIRCIAINSPTLNYFKNTHKKNWHTRVEQWPKAFRVLTDYGEGIYQVTDPRLDMRDLSTQTNRYQYYDVFGNESTPDAEYDWEQAKWRSVAWYPGIIAFRVQFPQFDRVLVGNEAWEQHIDRTVQEEIKGKSQALNIRLWDGGLRAYVLDYDPSFQNAPTASPMAWGTLPHYLNSIAWKRITHSGAVHLTPITAADIAQLEAILNVPAASFTDSHVEDLFNILSTFSFFWTKRDNQAISTTSSNMRQQTVAAINRGVIDPPSSLTVGALNAIVGENFAQASPARRRLLLYRHVAKNLWWSIPSEFSIWLRGSERVEMPQVIYPIGTDGSGNPIYPRFNMDTGQFDTSIGSLPFNPADMERLYYATFYNYGQDRPKVGFCRPEVVIKMNQLAMTERIFHQSRRSFGPADFGIDGVFRDVALITDLACPRGVLYLTAADEIHFAFTEDTFQVSERPTNNFIDYMDGWTAYKVMVSDMRRHGIYWGFQV